ncbi:MAG: DUF427 domain-containing protein [Actinomycetota bacterium]|nr:DUF427 domain-containing protein [Actinomycetota bacterium]
MAREPRGVIPDVPAPGQESVWDYPRPPRWDREQERIEIVFGGEVILATDGAIRVLETSHPPTYYLPVADFVDGVLRPAGGSSFCEWKWMASYFDVVVGDHVAARAAWGYPSPTAGWAVLLDHVAVYAAAMDRCTVGDDEVEPQPGGFYGGWVTPRVVGPFKGVPGSHGW